MCIIYVCAFSLGGKWGEIRTNWPFLRMVTVRWGNTAQTATASWRSIGFYYPPEVTSMKYCCLGVYIGRNTPGSSLNRAYRDNTEIYSWVVNIKNTSEAVLRPKYSPRPSY